MKISESGLYQKTVNKNKKKLCTISTIYINKKLFILNKIRMVLCEFFLTSVLKKMLAILKKDCYVKIIEDEKTIFLSSLLVFSKSFFWITKNLSFVIILTPKEIPLYFYVLQKEEVKKLNL